jgi:UDP-N-acetylglucosamine acyltransferase
MMWLERHGNKIHNTAVINWDRVDIGTGNEIGPYVCIGTDAQHRTEPSDGKIVIGDNNIIREYSTIHLPTRFSKITAIGSNCYLMALSHIAHDCVVENDVIFSNNATLGGHVHIMQNSQIGFSVTIHQHQVIGSYCMIGMGTVIPRNKKIIPGSKWVGNPARIMGKNAVGLERAGITEAMLETETIRYEKLCGNG